MKNKFFKRLVTTVAAAAMAVTMMAGTAMAAGEGQQVTPIDAENGSITVHVYDGAEGAVGDGDVVNDEQLAGKKPVGNVELKYAEIGQLVQYTDETSTRLMFHVEERYLTALGLVQEDYTNVSGYNLVEADTLQGKVENADANALKTDLSGLLTTTTTNSKGIATVSNADGLYLFVGGEVPDGIVTRIAPFLVSVPMPNANGSGMITDVHVYPKVRSIEDDFNFEKKAVTEEGADLEFVESGQTIKYTLTATVPNSSVAETKLVQFVVTDSLPNTLTLQGEPTVKKGDSLLVNGTDYTYAAPSSENDNTIKIEFKNPGDLAEGDTITITYSAKVEAGANLTDGITNAANLKYQYDGGDPGDEPTEEKVYTHGIGLQKTLSDGAAIQEDSIKFKLYRESAEEGNVVSVIKKDDGYWVAEPEAEGKTQELIVSADGTLNIKGLAIGTYVLKETKTMEGYSLLTEPITIVVEKDTTLEAVEGSITATVNGQNAKIENGLIQVGVENTKNESGFVLPKTGGSGTIAAVAVGFGCICAAFVLLSVYRRKGQK